jgi:predicted Zn finger-like uncharacterized protein
MIVACPNCESKYNLPDSKISPSGTKMRCAKCQHVFTAMPPAQDFDEELAGLRAAEAAPQPKPAPAPEPAPQKMPWDNDEPAAGPAGEPDAGPPKKMPWDDDEPAAGPAEEPDAGPPKKMPWDDDEPAAGPGAEADLDEPAAQPARGGAFDDEPPARQQAADKDEEFLNALGGGGASLDIGGEKPKTEGSGKKKWIILGVVLALLGLAGAGLYIFKPWTKMNLPFLGSMSGKPKEDTDNADKVKDIALRTVRQYYIPNEKAGQIFVVEGKAVNNFPTPKERIKVEVSLFDEKGKVLASKQLLCGNTLSQFQLQVQKIGRASCRERVS